MYRILMVTPDLESIRPVRDELARSGYFVRTCGLNRIELDEAMAGKAPEVIFWDRSAEPFLRAEVLRDASVDASAVQPITVAMVALGDLVDREPPECDDFLAIPARAGEPLLRLAQLLRKRKGVESAQILTFDGLVLDLASYAVKRHGEALELTYKEYELLRFLATHRGRVFTRETLLQQVWGHDYFGGARTVDVHIRRLRSKLGPTHAHLVETIRNVGYRFEVA